LEGKNSKFFQPPNVYYILIKRLAVNDNYSNQSQYRLLCLFGTISIHHSKTWDAMI
jgi:hypothetical protein